MKNKKQVGFTLIELLIVVAIIGILAAIAIPNFLNARIRAMIAGSESNMRNLSLVLASYQVDEETYPYWCMSQMWPCIPDPGGDGYIVTAVPMIMLTTPIQYTSSASAFACPFQTALEGRSGNPHPYIWRRYGRSNCCAFDRPPQTGGSPLFGGYCAGRCNDEVFYPAHYGLDPDPNLAIGGVEFMLIGGGPLSGITLDEAGTIAYDPTNGIMSRGTLLRTGP